LRQVQLLLAKENKPEVSWNGRDRELRRVTAGAFWAGIRTVSDLSHYAGRMGEVYRATIATRRDGCHKTYPEFARDPKSGAASAASPDPGSLNHPNIAAIYGWRSPGGGFLVLELVEGETLRRRTAISNRTHRDEVRRHWELRRKDHSPRLEEPISRSRRKAQSSADFVCKGDGAAAENQALSQ